MHQEARARRTEREREEHAMGSPHGEAPNRARLDRVESDGGRKGRRGDGRQAVEVPGQRGRVGDLPVHRPTRAGPPHDIAVLPAHDVQRHDAVAREDGDPLVTPAVDRAVQDGTEAAAPEIDAGIARTSEIGTLEPAGAPPDEWLERWLPGAGEPQPDR